jgi:hypothetical protein
MKYLIYTIIILNTLFLISCGQSEEQNTTITESTKEVTSQENDPYSIAKQHFKVSFQLEKVDDEHYNLIAAINLDSGCYVISPYSPDSIFLPFELSIPENNYITTDSTLTELPTTTEEYDSIAELQVKYAKVNTTYTQKLILHSQDDFQVEGKIGLLIEPSCVPYQIDFVLSNQSGELTVTKTKTTSLL